MSLSAHSSDWFLRRTCVGFIVCIWILAPFLLLQQFSLYEVIWLKEGSLDRLIPVNLHAVYVYFSYYLLLGWAGYGTRDRHFVRFLKSVCFVTLISHLCFFFFPTGVSRDGIEMKDAPLLYQWLVSWEKPRNCLPSLHASLATLSCLALWKSGWRSGVVCSIWVLAILWSAVSLRQHVLIDLGAGAVLAILTWFVLARKLFSETYLSKS